MKIVVANPLLVSPLVPLPIHRFTVETADQDINFGRKGIFLLVSRQILAPLAPLLPSQLFPKSMNGFTKLFNGLDSISGRPSCVSNRSPLLAERYFEWSSFERALKTGRIYLPRLPFPTSCVPSSVSSSSSATSTITVSLSSRQRSRKIVRPLPHAHSNSVSANLR